MTAAAGQDESDVIIVGSGAGGSAAAYTLTRAGLRVALLDRGGELPRDGSTLDPRKVVQQGVFKSHELWLDGHGVRFAPEEYFNIGGKTRWYGAALLRYGSQEFNADASHQCPGWPFGAEVLESYYRQAEKLLSPRRFNCEPDLEAIRGHLARHASSWHAEPLPLGLSPDILNNDQEARHFDGFASVAGLKADAETSFLQHVRALPNLTILTDAHVLKLCASAVDPLRVDGVQLVDGRRLRARAVLLAAGALHSPQLLQRYIEEHELAHLPCNAQVGRSLKKHLLTAVVAVSLSRKTDRLRKTLLFLNSELPHSSVQPLGFDGELIATLIPRWVPRFMAQVIGRRAYGFFLQTEDGAHPDNRIVAGSPGTGGLPTMDYDPARTPATLHEHQWLVRRFRAALFRAGMLAFAERIGIAGTAHASGTLMTGADPSTSVVDAEGRVHGLQALYVVDGSVLPRASRVNPALTIYAWSLRVAERLAATLKPDISPGG